LRILPAVTAHDIRHNRRDEMTDQRSGTQPDTTSAFTQLSDSASATKQDASSALTSAKGAVGDIADKAGDQASTLIDQVKEQASSALSGQKEGLAGRIDDIAHAVHESGAQFEGKQDWIASAIERGASELSTLATSLRENDLASLFGQVQSIARRQPALFIGASLAAGFAVARLGKIIAADVSRDDLPTLPEVGHGQG
jgi:hypothetical protein